MFSSQRTHLYIIFFLSLKMADQAHFHAHIIIILTYN